MIDNSTAATSYVDGTNGNDANDGRSAGKAFKTIQRACDELNFTMQKANHKISIAAGTYDEKPAIRNFSGRVDIVGANRSTVKITRGVECSRSQVVYFEHLNISLTSGSAVIASAVNWLRFRNCDISSTGNFSTITTTSVPCFQMDTNCIVSGNSNSSSIGVFSPVSSECHIQSSTFNSGGCALLVPTACKIHLDTATWNQVKASTYPYRLNAGGQVLPEGTDLLKMFEWYKAQNP